MRDPRLKQTFDYLYRFRSHFSAPQEALTYLRYACQRLLITLDMIPPGGQGKRLLELGANPYFMTLLLMRDREYELELANFFEDQFPTQIEQVVHDAQRGVDLVFRCRNFNGERDPFPYDDASFDFVLFGEILEHLVLDPTHLLCEIHRVLKPDGLLLVTTPNVYNLDYLMRLLLRRGNIFHPYSGYGMYARHHREYTMAELTGLLFCIGYEIVKARYADIDKSPIWQMALKRLRPVWYQNLFVLARKTGERHYCYPPGLYTAVQEIRRIVSSDVRMGRNEVGHIHGGWWDEERGADGDIWRWTARRAHITLLRPASACFAKVEVNAGATALGPVTLTVDIRKGKRVTQMLAPDHWQELVVPLEASSDAQVEIILSVDQTRRAVVLNSEAHQRDVGVMVRRVWLADN